MLADNDHERRIRGALPSDPVSNTTRRCRRDLPGMSARSFREWKSSVKAYHDLPVTRSRGAAGKHRRAAAGAGQLNIPNGSTEESRRGAFHSARRPGQPAETPGSAQARKARSRGRFLV